MMNGLRFVTLFMLVSWFSKPALAEYVLPEDTHPLIQKYRNAGSDQDREAVAKEIENKCPLKSLDSPFAEIKTDANNKFLSSTQSPGKEKACQDTLKAIQAEIPSVEKVQQYVSSNPTNKEDPAVQEELTKNLRASSVAANALHKLLSEGCNLSASKRTVAAIGNQIVSAIEGGSAVVSLVHPGAALIGAGAATAGRLILSLSQWLSKKESAESELAEEGKAQKYGSDLCHFKALNARYMKVALMPMDPKKREELEALRKKLQIAKDTTKALKCKLEPATASELQTFAADLQKKLNGATSDKDLQEPCMELMLTFSNEKDPARVKLDAYAQTLGCESVNAKPTTNSNEKSAPAEASDKPSKTDLKEIPASTVMFCKGWEKAKAELKSEKAAECADPEFAKKVVNQIRTVRAAIEFRITDGKKASDTERKTLEEQIKAAEQVERDTQLAFEALDQIINHNVGQFNDTKNALDRFGERLLGKEFDNVYARHFNDNAKSHLKDAQAELEKLKKFTGNAVTKQAQCGQIAISLKAAHDSALSLRTACDLVQNDGIPPSGGSITRMSTNSSAGIIDKRCKTYNAQAATHFKEIRSDLKKLNESCP